MDLTRQEIDEMLRRSAEIRSKLRRVTRELSRFGEQILAAREANGEQGEDRRPSDDDRSR